MVCDRLRSTSRFFCMDMKKPGDGIGRVVVIGGGSVGSLFSGRIAAIKAMKERVWLLTQWQEHFTVGAFGPRFFATFD
eukprot:3939906-Rhodomonas_salina.2